MRNLYKDSVDSSYNSEITSLNVISQSILSCKMWEWMKIIVQNISSILILQLMKLCKSKRLDKNIISKYLDCLNHMYNKNQLLNPMWLLKMIGIRMGQKLREMIRAQAPSSDIEERMIKATRAILAQLPALLD